MTIAGSQGKPKGFTQSIWLPIVIMGPIILFEIYGYFSNNDWHGLLSRIITIQMVLLTFLVPAYLGWAFVRWIEKRDPHFFDEDCGIPLDVKPSTVGDYCIPIIGLALILIGILWIKNPMLEGTLTIMGAMLLGIGLLGVFIAGGKRERRRIR